MLCGNEGSGDILKDAEVLGVAFMSHQSTLGCRGKMTPSSFVLVGEDGDRWPSYRFSFPKYSG